MHQASITGAPRHTQLRPPDIHLPTTSSTSNIRHRPTPPDIIRRPSDTIRRISDAYPTAIRRLSDAYPTLIRRLSDAGPQDSYNLRAHPLIRRVSDAVSDAYPTPIRLPSDAHPTPIRCPSDTNPTFLACRIQNAFRDGDSAFCRQDQHGPTDAHDAGSWGLPGASLAGSVHNALRDVATDAHDARSWGLPGDPSDTHLTTTRPTSDATGPHPSPHPCTPPLIHRDRHDM